MLFLGSLFYPVQSNQERPLSEKPVWHISLKVPENFNKSFIEAIKNFAESNDFAIRISSVGLSKNSGLIQLWRSDMKIIGAGSLNGEDYGIGVFFNTTAPVHGIWLTAMGERLKYEIMNIDGVTITR